MFWRAVLTGGGHGLHCLREEVSARTWPLLRDLPETKPPMRKKVGRREDVIFMLLLGGRGGAWERSTALARLAEPCTETALPGAQVKFRPPGLGPPCDTAACGQNSSARPRPHGSQAGWPRLSQGLSDNALIQALGQTEIEEVLNTGSLGRIEHVGKKTRTNGYGAVAGDRPVPRRGAS